MPSVAIIGGGPAGLMAAEILAQKGLAVTIYERKPSLGRKFLMAGRGGLNLTHSEPLEQFLPRYREAEKILRPVIENFTPQKLRDWCMGLGEETFIGSSGRVFPKSFKTSPLLRAWQKRLESLGVVIKLQHDWRGWDTAQNLVFKLQEGETETVKADATLLALGGASWPRLGSDGSWTDILKREKVLLSPLRPSNCGFIVAWSDHMKQKFAGQPLKPVTLSFDGTAVKGEMMITEKGIEGGAVYALSPPLREEIAAKGVATLDLDLSPDMPLPKLTQNLQAPRQTKSFSNFLRTAANLSAVAIGLLRETPGGKEIQNLPAAQLAALIKKLPLKLDAPFGIDRAISSAGGIRFDGVDGSFMLSAKPGVFVAGEMLDWEAPTGGYLLQATFSTAVHAAESLAAYICE